ncbi:MAG: nucleoside phosphorylase [Planctomycetota bacterium]|jgi:adenosylhomocysteine nucleosidase|nr:MAG: nucleoside phosphorylase [Planctomycetota bacterium]
MVQVRDAARDCAAGIVFAVPIEADAFERLASNAVATQADGATIHEGLVAGRRVAWCVAGVGRAAATRAARLLVDGHRPRLLVSAGFAGGLDPALGRGGVVWPTRVLTDDARVPLPLADVAAHEPVTIVTVDRIVGTTEEKAELFARTGAQIVDMETHAVADVARETGLPCAAVRVVSDDARQQMPREVAALVRPQSALRRLGTALGALGRRPGAAVDLWRLWEHAVVDGRTLAAALADLCGGLSAGDA